MFAIKDTDDNSIHSARFYNYEDAEFCIDEIAYEFDIEPEQLCVIQIA